MFIKAGKPFHRLQWKLILIFILLIMSVMFFAGTFLLNNVLQFYHKQFKDQMNNEFSVTISKSLELALADENPQQKINEVMDAFSTSRLGINGSNRNYYLLDGKGAAFILGSVDNDGDLSITPNIISALSGKTGDEVSTKSEYMDYAYPLKQNDTVKYIIYIRDSKQEILEVSHNLFKVIVQAILYGALIAMIIGIFLSRSITVPIRNLTAKAGKMAEGKFETAIEVKANDEIGVLTTTFNIMAGRLKKTLDEISSEKDKIEVILKNMAEGIIAFDSNGISTHINPSAQKMFSLDRNKKYKFNELFEQYHITLEFQQAMSNDEKIERDWQFECGGNVINAHFAPYKMENGKSEGVIVAFQDITKQQKLDNSRRAFVADVSHELRTPLTNIKSYSETLLDTEIDDPETRRNFLKVIDSEADRMTRLVKDLLVLSQLDHSKDAFKFEMVNIDEFVNGIVTAISIDAKKRNQSLTFVSSGTITRPVCMDKDRISQVIINIISNAIKYTPDKGSISVLCGQQKQNVYIKVTDTGIGIPEKDIPNLFERFYRVDKARSRSQGGTGLGLAIAKEIVEAHNGTISIESVYEKGTAVTVKLPFVQNENNLKKGDM